MGSHPKLFFFLLVLLFSGCREESGNRWKDLVRVDYEGVPADAAPRIRVEPYPGTTVDFLPGNDSGENYARVAGGGSGLISMVNDRGELVEPGKGVLVSLWLRLEGHQEKADAMLMVKISDADDKTYTRVLGKAGITTNTWTRLAGWYYRSPGGFVPQSFQVEAPAGTIVHICKIMMTYPPEKLPEDLRPLLHVDGDKIMAGDRRITLQGVNLSAYSSDKKNHFSPELSASCEDDYRRIAENGFNVIRLNLWYRPFVEDGGWKWLDIQRLWAKRHDLRLILDLHAPPGGYQSPVYKGGFWKDTPEAKKWQEQTLEFWQEAAKKFKNDPSIAGIDLLNEPKPVHDAQWWNFVCRAVKRIRAEGFLQPVIVESSFADDSGYELLEDKGIIYDYHFYDPWFFASGEGGKYLTACLPGEKGVVLDRKWLLKSLREGVLNFVQQHKVPLNIGEYGIAHEALKNGGLLWLQDLIEIMDKYHISRQYWCWHTYMDFSIERSGPYRTDPPEIDERILSIISVKNKRVERVGKTKGLIAFWDFKKLAGGMWTSRFDTGVVNKSFPVYLKHIGDSVSWKPENWPYEDENSRLLTDGSGPFGHAVRFNKGYIFGEVPRHAFDRTPLDLHGRRPFTLIAWIKFTGQRHMVAGIWDEGGWNKYSGRRQAALFGGLFGENGVIAHISATGAASFPQSEVKGAQYARQRAIDGQPFDNDQWVAMAMTYDPEKEEVTAYLDGVMTPKNKTDPVAGDVFRYENEVPANPFHFRWPVYSPRHFILKYNGYNVENSGVYEHWLEIDLDRKRLVYGMDYPHNKKPEIRYRVTFDILRSGKSLLSRQLRFEAKNGETVDIPAMEKIMPHDVIITSLDEKKAGKWVQVGNEVRYKITEGAPFTFGRALGLGSEALEDGTQLFVDGVAVFNRVLSRKELKALSFKE